MEAFDFKSYSALLVTSYCAVHRKDSFCMLAHGSASVEWGHPQGDLHVVAARLGRKSTMVGWDRVGQFLPWLHGQAEGATLL